MTDREALRCSGSHSLGSVARGCVKCNAANTTKTEAPSMQLEQTEPYWPRECDSQPPKYSGRRQASQVVVSVNKHTPMKTSHGVNLPFAPALHRCAWSAHGCLLNIICIHIWPILNTTYFLCFERNTAMVIL